MIKPRTLEIIALTQKYLKGKDNDSFMKLSLEELEDADINMGQIDQNARHRLKIRKRIEELKNKDFKKSNEEHLKRVNNNNQKKHLQSTRLTIIGILVSIILAILGWFYFK